VKRLLLAGLVVLGLTATASGAVRPKKVVFRATLSGSVSTTWQRDIEFVHDGCVFRRPEAGTTSVTFVTTARARLTAFLTRSGVRSLAGRIAGLRGTLAATAESGRASSEGCGRTLDGDAHATETRLVDGTVRVSRRAPGRVELTDLQFPLDTAAASLAPPELGNFYLRLELTLGRLDERRLRNPRVGRLVARASERRSARIFGDVTGQVVKDVRWTLTLRRVR
jgi:hypothetical protein